MAAGDVTATISKPSGKALYFDGVNDHIDIPLTLPNEGTIMVWMYPHKFSDFETVWDNSLHDDDWECWIYSTGNLRARVDSNIGDVSYNLTLLGGIKKWYHITYTWTQHIARLYINGILRDSDLIPPGTFITAGTNFYLGGGNPGNSNGNITVDNLRIFNRCLDQEEITKLYKKQQITKGIICNTSFNNTSDPAHDDSGNGNNGTVVGAISIGGHNTTEDDIKTARVSANDVWGFIPLANNQVMMAHIEEA